MAGSRCIIPRESKAIRDVEMEIIRYTENTWCCFSETVVCSELAGNKKHQQREWALLSFPGLIDFMCFNGLLIAIAWCKGDVQRESRSFPVYFQARLTSSTKSSTVSRVPSLYILPIPLTLTCFINRLVRFTVLKGWYLSGGVTSVGLIYEFCLYPFIIIISRSTFLSKHSSQLEYIFRFIKQKLQLDDITLGFECFIQGKH